MPIPKITPKGRSPWRKAVALTYKSYHSRKPAAAGRLRFFSGDLLCHPERKGDLAVEARITQVA
jgi:hypothetical protein